MKNKMKKLRIGFLVDSLQPSQQIVDLINFVSENDHFSEPLIITGYKPENFKDFFPSPVKEFYKKPLKFLNIILTNALIKIIKKIELRNVSKRFPRYQSNTPKNILNAFNKIEVTGIWSMSDKSLAFNDEDVDLISQQHLDCILQCGSETLKGDILNSSELGVISFHLADGHKDRGGPFGFWEVFHREPSSGFVIERLNHEPNKAEILFRGNLMTSNLWLANHAQLIEKCNTFLMQFLLNLSINRKLPKSDGFRLYRNNESELYLCSVFFKYLVFIIIPKILNSFFSILFSPRETRYSVAYTYHQNHTKLLSQYIEIPNPEGRFLADPFVFAYNENNYIFVEDFFYKDNKGRISVIKIDGDKNEFLDVIIEEDFHLSFPFVFKEDNEIFMIPESHENLDIRLYKCLEFPYKWKLEKILMSDVSAADTLVIKKEDTWFMLTNICSSKSIDHSELHIFYSDNLKSNAWKPIASNNPVIFDPLRGRNGGLFYHNEKIYRINQVHGQAHYGKSFNVNEIILLSKNEYIEKEILKVNANYKKDIVATHHFSANEYISAIDFTRYQRRKKALKT